MVVVVVVVVVGRQQDRWHFWSVGVAIAVVHSSCVLSRASYFAHYPFAMHFVPW